MISLTEMAELARALRDAQADVELLEAKLKEQKEYARVLREETLPGAMQELGLAELKLDTGETITITDDVYASIPADKKPAAFDWLEDHGFGGLIKTEVGVMFGKGEMDKATEVYDALAGQGMEPKFIRDVHPQTLRAFLREQMRAGNPVPLNLFGARPVFTTKLKGA
jgi:hypothetical protein